MPAVAVAPTPARTIRMTLLRDEYISEIKPFRFRAGTVVLVDEETARRWRENDIAVDSAETDKTVAEQKRARLEQLQREIEALESGEAVGDVGAGPEVAQVAARRRAVRR